MSIKTLIAVVVAVVSSSGAARAGCILEGLHLSGGGVMATYDVFSPSDLVAPLRSTEAGKPECANALIQVRIEPDGLASFQRSDDLELTNGSQSLSARIADRAGARTVNALNTASQALVFRLNGAGGMSSGDLSLVVPRGQRVAPGSYVANFRIVVESLDDQGAVSNQGETFASAAVYVEPAVGLSASWGTELDLGRLKAGGRAREPLAFRAYANAPYEIHLRSDNGFGLVRGEGASKSVVPYNPVLSGELLSSGSVRSRSFSTPEKPGYRDHALDIEVPSFPAQPAGEFRDYITVEIRALVTG